MTEAIEIHPAAGAVERVDLFVLCLLLGQVRAGEYNLPVQFGQLLVRERATALPVRQVILGPVLLDRAFGRSNLLGKLAKPLVQPVGRALCRFELRLQLIDDVLIR